MRILNLGCGGDAFGTHRLDLAPGTASTERGSATALPYRDGSFDQVHAANVLEHLPNPLLCLDEIARVLRPGGKLVLVTDHAAYWGYHFRGLRPTDNHRWQGAPGDHHYMLFKEGHLRNLCEAAGLRVTRIELFTKWHQSVMGRIVRWLLPPLGLANLRVEAERPEK